MKILEQPQILRTQAGVGLIEVLIALVVISIGLLGIAGLQVTGMAYTSIAEFRTTASVLANNMVAAMQANMGGVTGEDYDGIDTADTADSAPPLCRNAGASCTPEQIAARDAWLWTQQITRNLPAGAGSIMCNNSEAGTCDAQSTYTITVTWQEKELLQDEDAALEDALVTRTFETVFQP